MSDDDRNELGLETLKAKRDRIRSESGPAASLVAAIKAIAPTRRGLQPIRRPGLSRNEHLERMKLLERQALEIGGRDEGGRGDRSRSDGMDEPAD